MRKRSPDSLKPVAQRRFSSVPPLLLAPLVLAVATAHAQTNPVTLPETTIASELLATDAATSEGSGSYKASRVSVTKTPAELKEVPSSVSVITRQRMDDQRMTSVEDALRNTPGITAVSYGDGTSYYQSRGYPAEVQFDGLPANNGLQYLTQFDLALYDRVEVLRGPAGLLQGFGSPGGTVNLARKRPQDSFGLSGSVSAGSWDTYRTEIDVTGPLTQSGNIKGRFGVSAEDGKAFVDHSESAQNLVYGALAFDLGDTTQLTVGAAHQKLALDGIDYGLGNYSNGRFVDAKRSGFYGTPWSYADTTLNEVYADLVHQFGNGWQSRTAVNYRSADVQSKYGYLDGPVDPSDNTDDYWMQRQHDQYRWLGVDSYVSGPFELFGRSHDLMLGANYASVHQRSVSGGVAGDRTSIFAIVQPEPDIPYGYGTRSESSQYGVYGQVTLHPIDALSVILGGRQNHYESSRKGILPSKGERVDDPDQNKFTPYAGVVLALNSWLSAYASYADIFTPSQTFQTSFNGNVLKPRTGKQYELGLKGDLFDGRASASLALFQIDDRNRAVADEDHPTYWVAQGEARSRGVEAEISGKVTPNWDVQAGYTYLQTELRGGTSDGSNQDPEEPKHLFKLWNTYRFDNGLLDKWRVGAGVRAQTRTTRNEVGWQGGYAVVDALVGYEVDSHFDVALNMNNLLDRTYYARVPSGYYGLYGEPRNATLTLRMKY